MIEKELETRKCIVSGKVLNKSELLRFVVLKDGTFIPDFNKKFNERGIYVSNSKKILSDLVNKVRPLNKVLHKNVIINPELTQMVENILSQNGLNYINLARKAGELFLGFDQVKEIVSKGMAAFIIEAVDAGKDGKEKINAMAKNVEKFTLYDIDTMSKALGRDNTVYLAVKTGKIYKKAAQALRKYQIFLES